MEPNQIDDRPDLPSETLPEEAGCGWEWDHTAGPGDPECRECGAELDAYEDEEED
ncbi:hypothetical protein [Streptosporangium sp. G12]